MKNRNRGGRIDGCGREWCAGFANAHESFKSLGFIVGLYPGADIKRIAFPDRALEDSLVGNQDIRAACGENAAHLDERQKWIQRNGDAASPNDSQKPMKASPVVAAVNRDGLARLKRNRSTQESIDRLDICVQIGKTIMTVIPD